MILTVTVTDFIGGPGTRVIEGDEAHIERELRVLFPGASTGVEAGDLEALIYEIGRLPFVGLRLTSRR